MDLQLFRLSLKGNMKKDKGSQFQVSDLLQLIHSLIWTKQIVPITGNRSSHEYNNTTCQPRFTHTVPLSQVSNVNTLLIIISIKHTSEQIIFKRKSSLFIREDVSCMPVKLVTQEAVFLWFVFTGQCLSMSNPIFLFNSETCHRLQSKF